ncbi:ninein isoform X1 [Hypomesus transpacificus]|uniref:ninein isoform X1 n=1 Tax=Hypomesus transpacificus TaxID=137520 RepID=UPI001F072291|nr:ninein isoform X1 [Hypomesus transpacificus]
MDDSQQDQYEERLKEVFESFDGSGAGSLCPEELSDLCQALHLEEATPALLHVLLQGQNDLTGRIVFNQFKDALIQVLSSTIAAPPPSQEPGTTHDSPEVHPKFVRGSKRYGRRSTPEFIESVTEFSEVVSADATEEQGAEENDDTVPRKRERWNANESNAEEYEAEGQLQLWNPDEPGTPRGSAAPLSQRLEDRLREACQGLALPWDAAASLPELLALCEHLGLEVTEDVVQSLTGDGVMSVQEFVSRVVNSSKPPTPSASTPYRQLKRHHSTQPFDEAGRRMAAPSAMSSTIGTRLFSTLDDGTGYTTVDNVLDAWMEEGIENSPEILQALDFDLEGKLSLRELTVALENELLITKNGIHQAALASFKAEIRHLLERVDRELREKEKIRSDLEKAEKLKTQLATEVDEHHSAIERMNDLNIRKLEQDHRERLAAVRSELLREMAQVQQQAGQQREELEIQMEKIREDETFLRDHLSITVKENRRLEMELLDNTEKLVEAENQVSKLQKNLDNILKEKFGDLDPGSAEFFLQEERLRQLRSGYEEQCRELQDRIDELQAQLQEFHSLGRAPQLCSKSSLLDELESKSPGMESDPGIGSEEGQPFNMSLEAEMMLEQLKEQHLQEIENLRTQLESKIIEFEQNVEVQKAAHEEHREAISLQYQEEIQALREEMSSIQNRAQELQNQLEQAEQERASLELRQAGEREELADQQDEEVGTLRQELLQAHTHVADLEDQLKALEDQHAETELGMEAEKEELRRLNALELHRLEEEHEQLVEARLEEERKQMQEERTEVEKQLLEEWKRESEVLRQSHEETMRARVEELSVMFQAEREELEMSLTEEWERKRAQLDEQSNESLQAVLEEEMLRLVREHEERESRLRAQWDSERAQLRDDQEASLLARLAEEREKLQQQHEQREEKLVEDWKRERMQLEGDYEGMILERVNEEKEKLEAEKEELEKRLVRLMEEEKTRLEESQREAVQELCTRHKDEREQLSSLLDKLRDDISEERSEASRLAEENLVLRHKISALKEEDLRESQEEMLLKLEHFRKEKTVAQKLADNYKRQISELRLRSQQLEDENGFLAQKNTENARGVEELGQQLEALLRQKEKKEAVKEQHNLSTEERTKMAVCVSALEVELTKALEGSALLEEGKAQLSQQLSSLREKVEPLESQLSQLLQERQSADKQTQSLRSQLAKAQERFQALDETLQAVNLQSARLKSDLRVSQQEKDALKQEVISLHKQLQNANDKNQVLEIVLHSSGFQSQHKKLYRDELARLVEQEQELVRKENDRLQMEVHNTKGDLLLSREKIRQLEAQALSLKQQKQQGQSSLARALEQDKVSLRRELESLQKELVAVRSRSCEEGAEVPRELEMLRQENEGLKTQMSRLHSQLIETLQAQLGGLLPPSPRRLPGERRGPHRGEDPNHPENMPDERESMMIRMEERMREIELSLHNVKLLLKEKVYQLKEQLHRNGKSDVLIKDLYVENAKLLKALEMTEQHQKITDKKNYLLEEKISSLNKIVRDLNPASLTPVPFHFTCS